MILLAPATLEPPSSNGNEGNAQADPRAKSRPSTSQRTAPRSAQAHVVPVTATSKNYVR